MNLIDKGTQHIDGSYNLPYETCRVSHLKHCHYPSDTGFKIAMSDPSKKIDKLWVWKKVHTFFILVDNY